MQPTTVLYDGDCGLCNWCVQFARARDARGLLLLKAGPTPPDWFVGSDWNAVRSRTLIVYHGRTIHMESDAVIRVLRRMRQPYPVLGFLLWLVPKPWRDGAYRLVSRNRARLPKRLGAG